MHKILLVDTNLSSAPIYNYLMQSENEVYVVGGNPNDFLAKSVKNYINLDYSNSEKIRELIDKLHIDIIVPGCNDLSYQVCAKLNSNDKFYGIDSLETSEIINNKKKFKKFATHAELPVPRVFQIDAVDTVWPLIIKPVDAYSGRGITIVRKSEKYTLKSAVNLAKRFSRSKEYFAEEYIEGQLHSHSAFIARGNIVIDFIVEENSTVHPFVVDTSRVLYDFPLEMLNRIRDAVSLIIRRLNLVDGLIHTQFIADNKNFWLIEVTRRCPGDLYSQQIELSTGFNYAETYVKPFLNQKFSFEKNLLNKSWIMRHIITQPIESVFESIQFKLPIHIEKMAPISVAGDIVKASPFSRIGILFIHAVSKNGLDELYNATLKRDLYSINS